jgi:regulator of protease activity HflC (stomatin/prohibitin superfamily)
MGKIKSPRKPGLIMVYPLIDSARRIDMRTMSLLIDTQNMLTKDNVTIKLDAIIYYKITNPELCVFKS